MGPLSRRLFLFPFGSAARLPLGDPPTMPTHAITPGVSFAGSYQPLGGAPPSSPAVATQPAAERHEGSGQSPGDLRPSAEGHLARQVACAAGAFEHGVLGRGPSTATVVSAGTGITVYLLEPLSPLEREIVSRESDGWQRVRDLHERIFDDTVQALLGHVLMSTGVALRSGIAHVDLRSGAIIKTLATSQSVDLFVLGRGLPALGVPVDAHLHANGTTTVAGIGAVRR